MAECWKSSLFLDPLGPLDRDQPASNMDASLTVPVVTKRRGVDASLTVLGSSSSSSLLTVPATPAADVTASAAADAAGGRRNEALVTAEQAVHVAKEAVLVNAVEKKLSIAEDLVGLRAPDLAGARKILRVDRSAKGAAQVLITVGRVARFVASCTASANAVHAAERMVRDIVVLRCSTGIPPNSRDAFLSAAETAFGTEWHDETLQLRARVLLAYAKVMGMSINAFQSNSQVSAQKRGHTRPRRPRRLVTLRLPRIVEETEP